MRRTLRRRRRFGVTAAFNRRRRFGETARTRRRLVFNRRTALTRRRLFAVTFFRRLLRRTRVPATVTGALAEPLNLSPRRKGTLRSAARLAVFFFLPCRRAARYAAKRRPARFRRLDPFLTNDAPSVRRRLFRRTVVPLTLTVARADPLKESPCLSGTLRRADCRACATDLPERMAAE